jgi:uncharacterized ion transporter superfamily protein YfcC
MDSRAGAQISRKAFVQSLLILLAIMILAGVLTRVVPAGRFDRVLEGQRMLIQPDSFRFVETPDYPIWRWFTAPVEVLWSQDSLLVIVIALFILMVGAAFAVMEESGILKSGLQRIVQRYQGRKYLLLMLITLFFMMLGAFFGIFEEVVPLVPIILALSYSMGWDALVGLGMSILATNMGFSAAVTNPFTIGVAQELAGLPIFSGSWFRIPFFILIYAVLVLFLIRYARWIEKKPERSLVFSVDREFRTRHTGFELDIDTSQTELEKRALIWLSVFLVGILSVLLGAPFIGFLSEYALPLVGLLFLIGGVGAGLLSGIGGRRVWKALREGLGGIAPGVILILMAVSVKLIVQNGQIMDTILYRMSGYFDQASPFLSAVLIFFLALVIEFFISSGSAKAFLLMPILLPLADLVGVTRQIAVTAYCFGDGFSNMFYPTSAVLLISLGLTPVSLPKWLRWTGPLWMVVLTIAILFLGIAVAIGYGPF